MALASHIKSGRVERAVPRPLVWTMAVQAVALAIWLPAGFLAVTLCLFIIDERHPR